MKDFKKIFAGVVAVNLLAVYLPVEPVVNEFRELALVPATEKISAETSEDGMYDFQILSGVTAKVTKYTGTDA